jgi:Flp pilus assembly protein protease CpaA
MIEIIFLGVLALLWIGFAVVQDLKSREIANWLNFSLIIFALGFRFFYSLFSGEGFGFFYQGLIGFGIFFALGNLLYYGRMFAGGDAKLMMALGAVLPIYGTFLENAQIFFMFFLVFFFSGAIYSLGVSSGIAIKNSKVFKKEFKSQFGKYRKLIYFVMVLGLGIMLAGFLETIFLFLGILFFLLPYLYVFAKAIDESCMVNEVSVGKLTEGDWLYDDVSLGKKKIKAKWDGLSKEDIKLIKKKYKKVKIKQGIPFSPVFLISLIILMLLIILGVEFGKGLF